MVVVTLVGELLAKRDEIFVYCGPLSECRECKLKTVCFNLDIGRRYRVSSIRDVHHECKIHEDGVRVVEVESIEVPASIPSRFAVEGTSFVFESRSCPILSCEHYRFCHPCGVIDGTRYRISSVEWDISCELGHSLKKAMLS